jgi:hypothetical protein
MSILQNLTDLFYLFRPCECLREERNTQDEGRDNNSIEKSERK